MKIDQLAKDFKIDSGPNQASNLIQAITTLKDGDTSFVSIAKKDIESKINPDKHAIHDKDLRPDKKINVPDETAPQKGPSNPKGEVTMKEKTVKVNRIGIAMQRLIVEQAVSVMFANEPKLVFSSDTEQEKKFYKSLQKVLNRVRSNMVNKQVAREVFQAKEVAEIWYLQDSDHNKYGFSSKYKYRVKVCSPSKGDKLFPVFDEYGDMIAFGRQYSVNTLQLGSKTIFELFTDEESARYESIGAGGGFNLAGKVIPNRIKKIPVIYSRQDHTEWEYVQGLIERLETLLSNFADTNDYHASPKIFIEGEISGFSQKGEAGAILEGKNGAKASYLSWDNAPEAVKFEVNTLISNIAKLSQTPDFSFENVKGLSNVSGVALKLLFMDSHLKAKNKEEIFEPHLSRRASIISEFMMLESDNFKGFSFDSFEVFNEFRPFVIQDLKELVETLSIATNNRQFMAVKTATQIIDQAADIDEELELIEADQKQDVFGVVE